jgi:hypothetical protein
LDLALPEGAIPGRDQIRFTGAYQFRDVQFSYNPGSVLQRVDFEVSAKVRSAVVARAVRGSPRL